jgi:hypothetical protein
MAQNQVKNVTQALERAKETGEIFLASLSKEQLAKAGFDTTRFGEFSFADIYLIWDDSQFILKYLFDGNEREYYYEKPGDVGGYENMLRIIESYLSFKEDDTIEKGNATVIMVKHHPVGLEGAAVYVYKFVPHPVPAGMRIEEFFVATFDDTNIEIAWGMGNSVEEALKNAMRNWEKEVGEEEENPFKEALNQQEGE